MMKFKTSLDISNKVTTNYMVLAIVPHTGLVCERKQFLLMKTFWCASCTTRSVLPEACNNNQGEDIFENENNDGEDIFENKNEDKNDEVEDIIKY